MKTKLEHWYWWIIRKCFAWKLMDRQCRYDLSLPLGVSLLFHKRAQGAKTKCFSSVQCCRAFMVFNVTINVLIGKGFSFRILNPLTRSFGKLFCISLKHMIGIFVVWPGQSDEWNGWMDARVTMINGKCVADWPQWHWFARVATVLVWPTWFPVFRSIHTRCLAT